MYFSDEFIWISNFDYRMNRTERSIKMILTKENGTGKNAVVGGSDYTRFIAIAPSSAERHEMSDERGGGVGRSRY